MQNSGGANRRTGLSRKRLRRLQHLARLGVLCVLLISAGLWIASKVRRHSPRVLKPAAPSGPQYPDPPGIVLHSSMTPGKVHGVPIDAKRLEKIHADDHPQWATTFEGKVYHIGYHYVILPDGTVQKGRPDHCIGCHAPHYNTWLGICLVGSFDPSVHRHWKPSRPTSQQLTSLVALCERLMSEYHIPPERVLRHRDTKQTWCPGRRFPYKTVLEQLRQYAELHPETHSKAPAAAASPAGLASAGGGR